MKRLDLTAADIDRLIEDAVARSNAATAAMRAALEKFEREISAAELAEIEALLWP